MFQGRNLLSIGAFNQKICKFEYKLKRKIEGIYEIKSS